MYSISDRALMNSLNELHPSVWRASQLGHSERRCIDTGYPPLSHQLPGGGWPIGGVIELLVPHAGVGEMRLLGPALAQLSSRKIVLIDPTHAPNIVAFDAMGVCPADLIWLKNKAHADSLWAAETVARSGACGALVLWANHIRPESIRRLNLAAQTGDVPLYLVRPTATAQDASPAALRLSLRPAVGGVEIGFVKRRGPIRDVPLFIPMVPSTTETRRPFAPVTPVRTPAYVGDVGIESQASALLVR